MAAVNLKVKGGAKLRAYLAGMAQAIGGATGVRAGFLESETYQQDEKGKSATLHVAQVAFWNEFGTSTAPARPFFRQMIAREQDGWGDKLAKYLRSADYDTETAFRLLGLDIKDELTNAIASWPGDNAASTIRRKGFNHGLVDSGVMQRATGFEVLES
jgi:hypothetical protein